MPQFIQYIKSKIGYYVYGAGKQTVICFHGYGSVGSSYAALQPFIEKDFTLVSIELPFHSHTRWHEKRRFYASDVDAIINQICDKENLSKDIWVMGFSLGGRIALTYFQYYPQKVKRLLLLAPDGLYQNFWYWFIAKTLLGNALLLFVNNNAKTGLVLTRFFFRMKAINAYLYILGRNFLNNTEERKMLVHRWVTFRKMFPNLRKVAKLLKKHRVQAIVLFGLHDNIISPTNAQYLQKKAPNNVEVKKIKAGHLLFREEHIQEVAKLFYNKK